MKLLRSTTLWIAAIVMTLAILTPAAWGQTTTYASPVKVMNTPVPVSGAVTVTPASGTMPVSGSVAVTGTPQVTLSGTPAVTLSGNDNKVQVLPAGTPFAQDGEATLPDGTLFAHYTIATAPATGIYTVIEFVAARCVYEQPGRLWVADLGVTTPGSGNVRYTLPMTSFLMRGTHEWYSAATPVKIYASPGSSISIHMQRSTGDTGYAKCTVSVSGRSY